MATKDLSERERTLYEDLALLHGIQNLSFSECARQLGYSARTLQRWARTTKYQQIVADLQTRWREEAEATLLETAKRAVLKMIWLMEHAKPGSLVQYYAAKALMDAAGLGQVKAVAVQDDRAELDEIYRLLRERELSAPQVTIQLPPGSLIATPGAKPETRVLVGPGGEEES